MAPLKKVILRDYQETDISNIEKEFKKHDTVMYQLATGGGKSVVFSEFISRNSDKNIVMMVHRRHIVDQVEKHLNDIGLKPGLIVRGNPTDLKRNIQLAQIQTFQKQKRLDHYLSHTKIDYLIIDEAHHTPAKSYQKIIKACREKNNHLKLLGVTATPWRLSAKDDLSKIYKSLVCSSKNIQQLINAGYLAKFRVFNSTTEDLEKVQQLMGDYNITSLGKFMMRDEMVLKTVESYKRHADGKTNIVFCVNGEHALKVKEAYIKAGYKAETILHKTPDSKREKILSDFRKGKLQILITVLIVTEGFDAPDTQVVQICRPTKSLVLYLQMVGRGLRPKEDKSELILLDNANVTIEHGMVNMPREWSLEARFNPNKARKRRVIIGRRLDGTFTAKSEEMEGLELEELDVNDYLEELKNESGKIEEYNTKLDLMSLDAHKNLTDYLNEKYPLPDGMKFCKLEDVDEIDTLYVAKEKEWNPKNKYYNNHYIGKLEYKSGNDSLQYTIHTGEYYSNIMTQKNTVNFKVASYIAPIFNVKSIYKKTIDLFKEAQKLQDQKKDPSSAENKQEAFVKELKRQYIIKLIEESTDKYFEMPKRVYGGFKDTWDLKSQNFDALQIKSPTIRSFGIEVEFFKKSDGGWNERYEPVGKMYKTNTLKMCTLDRLVDYFIKGEWDFSELGIKPALMEKNN